MVVGSAQTKISESGKIVAAVGHGTIEKFAIDGIFNRLSDHVEKNELDLEIKKSKLGYWIWRYDIGRR